jgi:outer membrane immunogenic protein
MSKPLAFISALAAFVVAASGLAFAADMAVKAPPPPPAPVTSWTGWYGGLNAGGTWSDDPVNVTTTNLQFCGSPTITCGGGGAFPVAVGSAQGATGTLSGKTAGFIGGGQFGYNLQFGDRWVTGFEADIQGIAGDKGTGSTSSTIGLLGFPTNSVTTNMSATREIDYRAWSVGMAG